MELVWDHLRSITKTTKLVPLRALTETRGFSSVRIVHVSEPLREN